MCANSRSADRCFLLFFVTPAPLFPISLCVPSRGLVQTRAAQLFAALVGNHHRGFLFLSASAFDLWMERKRQGEGPDRACGLKMSRHCSPLPHSLLLSLSLSFSTCLGCLTFSSALIAAFVKKKNSFLMKGPGCVCNFMDFIWRHIKPDITPGSVATSKGGGVAVCYY